MAQKISQADWDAVRAEIRQILVEVTKARQVITYSELTAMLQTAYLHYHSTVLVKLLTDIGAAEVEAGRPILPALVVTKQTGMPGAGYFKIRDAWAVPVDNDPQAVWSAEVARVHDYWSVH